MSHRAVAFRPSLAVLVPSLVVVAVAIVILSGPAAARQPGGATAEREATDGLVVPPLPEGTPEQLLEFIDGLMPPKVQPRSRREMMKYITDVAKASVQAADAILPRVKAGDPIYAKAATLKLENLMRLGQLGDEQAAKDMAVFAATLVDSPVANLAMEAKRLLIVADAQRMFT
jgi:hypothetical protein